MIFPSIFLLFLNFAHASQTWVFSVFFTYSDLATAIESGNMQLAGRILKQKGCSLLLKEEDKLLSYMLRTGGCRIFDEEMGFACCEDAVFFDSASRVALKNGNRDLTEFLITSLQRSFKYPGSAFQDLYSKCIWARNYSCIERLEEYQTNVQCNGKTLAHYAGLIDDSKILKSASENAVLLSMRDFQRAFPFEFVRSKKMSHAIQDRWDLEEKLYVFQSADIKRMQNLNEKFNLPDNTLYSRLKLIKFQFYSKIKIEFNPVTAKVRRDNILGDSFVAASHELPLFWYDEKYQKKIEFLGEKGVDAGGPTIEWLELIMSELFEKANRNSSGSEPIEDSTSLRSGNAESDASAPVDTINTINETNMEKATKTAVATNTANAANTTVAANENTSQNPSAAHSADTGFKFPYPLFVEIDSSESLFAPNPMYMTSGKYSEEEVDVIYRFAGSILALAFLNEVRYPAQFIPSIYRAVFFQTAELIVNEDDLQQQDPETVARFNWLKTLDAEQIAALSLTFPSDPNIDVTGDNLNEYIQNYTQHLLFGKYSAQIQSIQSGFKAITGGLSTHLEFSEFIMSVHQNRKLAREDFIKYADVKGSLESKKMFLEMINEFDDEEMMKFFKFVTARDRLPIGGLAGLKYKFTCFMDVLPEESLPDPATCFNLIKFAQNPESKEQMKMKLFFAIENSGTFESA